MWAWGKRSPPPTTPNEETHLSPTTGDAPSEMPGAEAFYTPIANGGQPATSSPSPPSPISPSSPNSPSSREPRRVPVRRAPVLPRAIQNNVPQAQPLDADTVEEVGVWSLCQPSLTNARYRRDSSELPPQSPSMEEEECSPSDLRTSTSDAEAEVDNEEINRSHFQRMATSTSTEWRRWTITTVRASTMSEHSLTTPV